MKTIKRAFEGAVGRLGYHRWPWVKHAYIAALALVVIVAAGAWTVEQRKAALHALVQQQAGLQHSLQEEQRRAVLANALVSEPDFGQRLPVRSRTDDVVGQLAQLVEKAAISVGSISLLHAASDAKAIGRVDVSFTLTGAYAPTKALLSELLSRNESLGIQTLTVRSRGNDALRLEWVMVLSLFVRD